MNVREITISKLDQLPDSLVEEVNQFIDFVIYKNQLGINEQKLEPTLAEKWLKWFEDVEKLNVNPTQTTKTYSESLIDKYRQQGLDL
jgi:hypothetical protein